MNRANQALQTLERYKARLDDVSTALSALEVGDLVTVRDVAGVLQRNEMVRRIAEEIDGYIVELGADARLVRLQLDELMGDVEDDRYAVMHDYLCEGEGHDTEHAVHELAALGTDDLLDVRQVASLLCLPQGARDLDRGLTPKGYRLLARVPRLPSAVIDRIVRQFGSLPKIMRATIEDLDMVEGVGEARAVAIKEGLSRLAETSILDRYS